MNLSNNSTDSTDWSDILSAGDGSVAVTKTKRGRPSKKTKPVAEEVPFNPSFTSNIPDNNNNNYYDPNPVSEMSTLDLIKTINSQEPYKPNHNSDHPLPQPVKKRSSSRSKSPVKNVKFEDKSEEEELSDKFNRKCLIGIHNEFYDDFNSKLHKIPRMVIDDSVSTNSIDQRVKLLQECCIQSNPTDVAISVWSSILGLTETVLENTGNPIPGLSVNSQIIGNSPMGKQIFRDLLIKYPYMRYMIGMGDFPELKLLMMTMQVVEISKKIASDPNLQQQLGSNPYKNSKQ
jgi:hypothetical protein